MFCLKGRNNGGTKLKEMLKQDDFGWWLNNENDIKSPRTARSKDRQSVGSTESMFSCVDSDDSDSYFLAQEFKQERCNDNYEKIELTSLINDEDLDINLIEQDAIRKETDLAPYQTEDRVQCTTDFKRRSQESHGVCYTPERLVRSQKYRILTPSPRYLSISQVRDMPENPWKTSLYRRRLNYLIDSNQDGAMKLKAFMNPNPKEIVVPTIDLHRWRKYERVYNVNNETIGDEDETKKEKDASNRSESLDMSDYSFSKRSIYERLNDTWQNCDEFTTRNTGHSETSLFDDTSGIQSNDSTSNTHTLNMQSTPLCLSDELATTNYKNDTTQEKCSTTNEAVSIFETLDTNGEEAAVLLEEDPFYDSMSTHDRLTRLALAIETDENMSAVVEKEPLIHLQNKIRKLQDSNKDIYRDISELRKSFQSDEEKMADVSFNTSKLRQEVHDLRYLDDLLNLLRGELERISKRNWPFVIGHTNDHSEEMNLIV